jgi:LysR family transcriptional regulator, regulator of peptidoglycan recycling
MRRDEIADLAAFVGFAEERSFTKVAQRLGMAAAYLQHAHRLATDAG